MLIKIDHRVSYMIQENRDGVVAEMERSGKMYNWVKGEDIGDTVERFAIANPRATFGQMLDWSKRTYMARLEAQKKGQKVKDDIYKSDAFDPTSPSAQTLSIQPDAQQPSGVTEINDYVPARPKQRNDVKKVAEPGSEPAEDEGENPGLPSADVMGQPAIEQDDGVDAQGNRAEKPNLTPEQTEANKPKKDGGPTDPLAKFKTV
jgi:hypothetical protein